MKVIAILALVIGFSANAQDVYTIDPAHTTIAFKINHMGFSSVYGTFGEVEGKISVDEKAPEKSSFDVIIKADSVSTHQKKRDDHLRSPDFFNVKQFPTIVLKSKSVKKSGDKYDVTADLTLHGVTKPVNFTFTRMKTGKDQMGAMRTGGEGHLKIKRTDFGMNFMSKPGEVGDEVELMFGVEGAKK
jgi:polyisoprenoid-binding protein YceI